MRRLVKQFQLSGQHRDTNIRLGTREVWLKCVVLVSSFRQSLKRCSLLGSHWPVVGFFVGFRVRMQPQTMNAATIAQKITNGISCIDIVVFSVA